MASVALRSLFANLRIAPSLLAPKQTTTIEQRFRHIKAIPTPKPGVGKQYRRCVGYVFQHLDFLFLLLHHSGEPLSDLFLCFQFVEQ